LPGGPVDSASRWAATSNVEVGRKTYPVNGGGRKVRDGGKRKKTGIKSQRGEGRREWRGESAGPLS